jgi:hypothetical protein
MLSDHGLPNLPQFEILTAKAFSRKLAKGVTYYTKKIYKKMTTGHGDYRILRSKDRLTWLAPSTKLYSILSIEYLIHEDRP